MKKKVLTPEEVEKAKETLRLIVLTEEKLTAIGRTTDELYPKLLEILTVVCPEALVDGKEHVLFDGWTVRVENDSVYNIAADCPEWAQARNTECAIRKQYEKSEANRKKIEYNFLQKNFHSLKKPKSYKPVEVRFKAEIVESGKIKD